MARYSALAVMCLLLPWLVAAHDSPVSGTADGSEQWGYVDVRPGAHMFWWWYRSTSQAVDITTVPVIMWLQGGPGGSSVGVGDFQEIGPLDEQLQPRNHSWVEIADLLFLDNPVGTGFSYVDEPSLLATNNTQIAHDLLRCLKGILKERPDLSKRSWFIFSESYGGKYASEFGILIHEAIASGSLDLNFGGVALGDAWISPLDSMYSWASFLHTNSRLDAHDVVLVNKNVDETAGLVKRKKLVEATNSWENVENLISNLSNRVDFYNILNDDEAATNTSTSTISTTMKEWKENRSYFRNFYIPKVEEQSTEQKNLTLTELMNTVIRDKLQIIPSSVRFQISSQEVFTALKGDFMKDTIQQVDKLLLYEIKVAVYQGQLDLIVATPGTEAWVQKLKWEGLKQFNKQARTPLYCNSSSTKAFVKKHKNLSFYWILKAGHFVPADSPCVAQQMAQLITS